MKSVVRAIAAVVAAASLHTQLDRALQVPKVPLSSVGATAIDLATGETVYSRNPGLPLLPASNEKLAVTYAALTGLGPAFRIETDVLGEGDQDGTTWTGDVVLKGYGDPTLSSAGLAALARQVRADGIVRVSGHVLGDESWFDARRAAPGWKASFLVTDSPPLSALTVDRSTSRRPALVAAQLFRRALAHAGVTVDGGAALGSAGGAAVPLASIDSPTVATMVHAMDRVSDNFTAEMLLKELGAVQAGRGTTAAGAGVVTGLLELAGVQLDGVRIVDGSGLSLLDRMTSTSLVSLLNVMWDDTGVRLELLSSLPVAGRSGTLADRMRGTAAEGVVLAKTGTTDNATALSGFVGDRFVFSVLVNGHPVSWAWSRAAEDRFATVLARFEQLH
jgi:D-alanyl-D-alanine carboxypeptidase/D-alanyl-D-alanine-endopeptidase (penicillin-binding protein 4)